MKNKLQFIVCTLVLMLVSILAGGCLATAPEYYEELDEKERIALRNNAKILAIKGKAVPEHLQAVFLELAPYERIIYEGNKRGRATFRWEIYENSGNGRRITQKDINPYWVMVYANGNLRDPDWKLTHARENLLPTGAATSPKRSKQPAPGRKNHQVRYKR